MTKQFNIVDELLRSFRELSSTRIVKHISQSWLTVIGFILGIMSDYLFFIMDDWVSRKYPDKHSDRLYIFVIGFLQIMFNVALLRISKAYGLNGDLFSTGVLLPQSLVIQRLYRK